jgi:redox-sensitive bicupin YhaK (pirin superfamily)
MGHGEVIRHGDVQVMSAGTGISHSEFNHSQDLPVRLLQIWIRPKSNNVVPRYQQISIDQQEKGAFHQILSPSSEDEGVWIHQDAWFYLGDFDQSSEQVIPVKGDHAGVYFFVIEGEAEIEGQTLGRRDAMGVWDTNSIRLKVGESSRILAMEVPMST